ncbi:PhoPQ-activated pathogenicity-related family protein [soil metagenome]
MLLLPLIALLAGRPDVPSEFGAYLAKPDSSYSTTSKSDEKGMTIDMTSQTWQGIPWKHTILYTDKKKVEKKGIAILYITGDGPRPGDYMDLALINAATTLPVATLFNVPNQPLWDMKEDDLIAYSFDKYLSTGDASWPLLFPMAKSAIRAMDAIQAATKNSENPIKQFVVTGASKRGWTTWFVGASKDPRVIGIAPMVIDNLNVAKQMPHQLESWGKYSEQIEEYTRRGLQAKLATPEGRKLGQMIDPYSYLPNVKVPTLIVTAANDPYWAVDAMSQYWGDLKMPHWATIIPNAGHDLGDKIQVLQTVGSFAASLSGDFKMPQISWTLSAPVVNADNREMTLKGESKGLPFDSIRIWTVTSDTLDFRPEKWTKAAELSVEGASNSMVSHSAIVFAIPANKNVAVLAEAHYHVGSKRFTLSRPVTVFKARS